MSSQNSMENESQLAQNPESRVESREVVNPEAGIETEKNAMSGAEILENPPDDSFIHGLQLFIAWVKNLVADD